MKTNLLVLVAVVLWPFSSLLAQTQADLGGAASEVVAAAPVDLSPMAAEVVRLAEAGTSDEVLLAYIQNSTTPFSLMADQILYLKDIGLTSDVLSAMLKRDADLREAPGQYVYDQKLYPATVPPPAPVVAEAAPQQPSAPVAPAPPVAAAQPVPAAQPVAVPPAVTVASPVYVSSPPPDVTYFYDSLAPYGTWIQLQGLGWCWQPRVVVIQRTWRPYCDGGRWLYTDAGWFWQSDYSWGWAPFHYGRWHFHTRCGWVWLPDRVWGPAWVTWRVAGNTCGWAPLPPHADFDIHLGYRFNGVHVGINFDFGLHSSDFTFIALKDFHRHDLGHYRLPPVEVNRVYKQTTIVNNYVVERNIIVNQGIKVDRVSAATHTQFRKMAIRDVPAGSVTTARLQTSGRGARPVAYRTKLQAPSRPVHMVAQKVDNKHPVIQHAPLAAATVERKPTTATKVSRQAAAPRNLQPAVSGIQAGRAGQSPVGSRPPATVSPGRSASPAPSAQRNTGAARSVTTSARNAAEAREPAARVDRVRPTAPLMPESPQRTESPRLHPLRVGEEAERAAGPDPVAGKYYPKGYYQAAETRALPPVNQPRTRNPNPAPAKSKKNDPGR